MDERRMEIEIGSPVIATDGNCGHIQRLVIDPHQKRVIGLAIKPDPLSRSAVTVPIEQVVQAGEGEVRLNLDSQGVQSFPVYKEDVPLPLGNQRYLIEKDEFVTRSTAGVEVIRAPSSNKPGMVESQILQEVQLPLAISIRAGQHVFCKDGYIGRVQLLLLDPSGMIEGVVLRTSGRNHHDFILPVDWIRAVDQKNVHLTVEKQALEHLNEYVADEILVGKIDHALWENDELWVTQFSKFGATVQAGIVTLHGHVPTASDKLWVENAVKSVVGVSRIDKRLLADNELTIEVAQALGKDERTRFAAISVNTCIGFVTLSGYVNSAATQYAAIEIAASVPNVRGVMNHILAPDILEDPVGDRFHQPPIGKEVYASDIALGMVEKVIINPHNRRVIAFIVNGDFHDPKNRDSHEWPREDLYQRHHVILPSRVIRYETDAAVFLDITGKEAANYGDCDTTQFAPPPDAWKPPYPYHKEDILLKFM